MFKALGLLLTYPEEELILAMGEISEILDASGLCPSVKSDLKALTEALSTEPLLDSQERYVRIFDRSTRLSLYLYEHVHGESRDRGQAMVDLRSHYERFGLVATESELPDYVPVLCEFVSLLDSEPARDLLEEIAPLFALLGSRLADRKSHYAAVLAALVELSNVEVNTAEVERAASEDGALMDDSFESLDRVWAESEVTFGAGDAHDSCRGGARPPGSDLVQLAGRKSEQGEKPMPSASEVDTGQNRGPRTWPSLESR